MKYFLDENLHAQIPAILRALAPEHDFSNAYQEDLAGRDDVELIPEVAKRGFHAIITDDGRQMVVPEEAAVIRDSGMHWVRMAKANVRGLHGLSAITATLVSAVPHLLDLQTEVSCSQKVKLLGRGRERGQVLRFEPL